MKTHADAFAIYLDFTSKQTVQYLRYDICKAIGLLFKYYLDMTLCDCRHSVEHSGDVPLDIVYLRALVPGHHVESLLFQVGSDTYVIELSRRTDKNKNMISACT